MILANYESMRVTFAIRAYGATPDRGPDGRFVFPTNVAPPDAVGFGVLAAAGGYVSSSLSLASRFPWDLSTNVFVLDAVDRVDEWDWYLWHEAGWLELRREPDESQTSTESGGARLWLTAAGLAEFPSDGSAPLVVPYFQRTIETASLRRLLRATYVYAQERATGDVTVFDLSAIVFGGSVGNVLPES